MDRLQLGWTSRVVKVPQATGHEPPRSRTDITPQWVSERTSPRDDPQGRQANPSPRPARPNRAHRLYESTRFDFVDCRSRLEVSASLLRRKGLGLEGFMVRATHGCALPRSKEIRRVSSIPIKRHGGASHRLVAQR
jgi:hypothetical protein